MSFHNQGERMIKDAGRVSEQGEKNGTSDKNGSL